MSRYKELNALKTVPHTGPVTPGILATAEEAAANTHPFPILYDRERVHFTLVCVPCGLKRISRRELLQTALADRITHHRDHHQEVTL